jgi:hypothetical protein
MCSKLVFVLVFSSKMYTGNRITHLTWHARGQSTYQLPVKESLVRGPLCKKEVQASRAPDNKATSNCVISSAK